MGTATCSPTAPGATRRTAGASSSVELYHAYRGRPRGRRGQQRRRSREPAAAHRRSYLPVRMVHASRGKYVRAEPVSSLYEQGRVHHVGCFPELEDQMAASPPTSTARPRARRTASMPWCGGSASCSSSIAIRARSASAREGPCQGRARGRRRQRKAPSPPAAPECPQGPPRPRSCRRVADEGRTASAASRWRREPSPWVSEGPLSSTKRPPSRALTLQNPSF